MPTPATATSTPRLSEVARHIVIPEGIVTTAWPRVVKKCEELGVAFDLWQHGIGSIALGKRLDGKYAATVGGVVLSIPRQVGKTFLVGMIVIALCLIFPGLTVLWTAHRTRTATKTFQTIKGMTSRKKIKPHMLEPRNTNGEQEVRFRNTSVIMFGARDQGFGRGFDEVDIEVFDEAQILTEKALEDMVAATNQSRQESGALLFFMGTPPRPGDPGEEFSARRSDALGNDTSTPVRKTKGDSVYVEFSADADAKLDDRKQWAKANPSFPRRTPLESMLRMRAQLKNDDSFRREALGIWDDKRAAVFGPGNWDSGVGRRPAHAKVGALALAVSFDESRSCISAGARADGLVYVKPLAHGPGTRWTIEKAVELQQLHGVDVAIDERGPAAVLIPDLEAAGVRLRILQTIDVLDACSWIQTAVTETHRLRHGEYPELDRSFAGATKRAVGDRWAWGRKTSKADLSPAESVTFAGWIADQRPDQLPPSEPLMEPTSSAGQVKGDLMTAGF